MWTPLPGTAPLPSPIEYRNAGKRYGKTRVFDNLNLAVEPGTTLGLIGTNGAGKTTLIKCLLDFCQLDSGSISIFGIPHTRTQARSQLVYLPERFNAPGYLSGEQYLRLLLKLHNRNYDSAAAVDLFDRLDVGKEVLTRRIKTYSKGMAQKLGIILCVLAEKPLMVLDEPMSGLDPKSRVLFKQLMSDYHNSGGSTFFSTHMLNDVESLCDRIAILHDQSIRYFGNPEDCCRQFDAKNLEDAYMRCLERSCKQNPGGKPALQSVA